MTLEEAKLQVNISIKSPLFKKDTCIVPVEAIDTALKALEEYDKQMDLDYVDKNYVSKEYHEMVVKEQNDIINDLKSRADNSISYEAVIDLMAEDIPSDVISKACDKARDLKLDCYADMYTDNSACKECIKEYYFKKARGE